ncbi:MAG: alpha amylase, partial [Lachnospiraceae bacterium]|nr:alpha amylase [Lachnospiraceae bacterium]
FITNHDQGRPCNIFQSDPDAMKFAGGLLSIMSGNPFIYYGEEVGMKSKGSKDENKRLAMNWSVTDKEGTPKDPKDADKGIEQSFPGVYEQECDPDSILTYYKRALYMRNSFPEIARGEGEVLPPSSGMQAIMSKEYEGSKIYIAVNSGKKPADFDISSLGGLEVACSLTLHGEEIALEGGVLKMPERSICILK